jgi:flagellin-like protein
VKIGKSNNSNYAEDNEFLILRKKGGKMLTRLLKKKRYFRNIYKNQKGITGLETAIILIAFVVVAAVFAYTVLSAGLFSTQKSQEAVYSGLKETQNTIDLKGAVTANGYAMLNNCDYTGWTPSSNVTMTRETSTKWEGSGALSAVIDSAATANETLIHHGMTDTAFTAGDTVAFWLKADAALDGNITFALATSNDLQGTAVETHVISTGGGTNWQKHEFDLSGEINPTHFGIYLSTDAEGTFILDNVMFIDIASQNGISLVLDNCDYPDGWTNSNNAVARDTADANKVEGTGALAVTVAGTEGSGDELVHHLMEAKEFSDGDVITFWAKASVAMSDVEFGIATDADISANSTQNTVSQTIELTTDWQKYSMTLSGSDDTTAAYYGLYLSGASTAGSIYLDDIEIDNAGLNNNNDPMNSFGNEIHFTVSLANAGDGVDFTSTIDSNGDGLLSDESSPAHKVIVYYNDEYQALTDLAWTAEPVGKDDGDSILDSGEKFQVTVDLTYVNQNSGVWSTSKIGNNQTFTIEVKPPTGAVLTIERTMPPKVLAVNNLN